jgi:hypothetical protein
LATKMSAAAIDWSRPWTKLLTSPTGKILLRNIEDALNGDLLVRDNRRLVIAGLHRAAKRLSMPYRFDDLVNAIFDQLGPYVDRLQVAGLSQPAAHIHLVAFRGWPDIRVMLKRFYKHTKAQELAAFTEMPVLSESLYRQAADAVNRFAAAHETPVTLEGAFNIVFLTSKDQLDKAVPDYATLHADDRAERIRDLLGLIQVGPNDDSKPYPLFAFHSMVAASQLMRGARIARPTVIDGFNNQRFKQHWDAADLAGDGGGMTVDLANPFGPGSSEFVSTASLIRDRFTCSYVGEISRPPPTTDEEYVAHLPAVLAGDFNRSLAGGRRR